MIRRAIAVLVITASAVIGSASAADAGELCVRLLPTRSGARLCIPTQ
jgi:hypothetical protein